MTSFSSTNLTLLIFGQVGLSQCTGRKDGSKNISHFVSATHILTFVPIKNFGIKPQKIEPNSGKISIKGEKRSTFDPIMADERTFLRF